MKLAFSIQVDVEDGTLAGSRSAVRHQLAEDLRAHLVQALEDPPVDLRDVHVWARATPERMKRRSVEAIQPLPDGRHRVTIRVEDDRTTSRTFPSRLAAEAFADHIDPLFLPGDPVG